MTILSFDTSRFCLGSLCKREHRWNGTEQSFRKIGKNKECVECRKEIKQKYQEKNRERILERQRLKYQKNKDKINARRRGTPQRKEYGQIYHQKNKDRKSQYDKEYYSRNKERIQKRTRLYQHQNKELVRLRFKRYYAANSEEYKARAVAYRKLKRSVHNCKFGVAEVRQRLNDFSHQCAYCGKTLRCGIRERHFDHFIPVSAGGSHNIGNIVPACQWCNLSKHNKDPYEWYSRQPFYSRSRWLKILKVLGKTDANYTQLTLF